MGGKPSQGTKHDKRLDKKSPGTKMPLTKKQMNAQHKRMTGGRKT